MLDDLQRVIPVPEVDSECDVIDPSIARTLDEVTDGVSAIDVAPEEMTKIERLVHSQYDGEIAALKTAKLYTEGPSFDVKPPSKDVVAQELNSLLASFQYKVIESMDNAVLQLIPVTKIDRIIEAFEMVTPEGSHFIPSESFKRVACEADNRELLINRGDILAWEVAITEGAPSARRLKGDGIRKKTAARYEWFQDRYLKQRVSGPGIRGYLMLHIANLCKQSNEKIDDMCSQRVTTMLTGEPLKNGCIAEAAWDSGNDKGLLKSPPGLSIWLSTMNRDPRDEEMNMTFRPSIVKRVPSDIHNRVKGLKS